MESITKALILSAVTIITILTISFAIYYSNAGKIANTRVKTQNVLSDYYSDISKGVYDGMHVTGTEVIHVLRKFSRDYTMGVRVVTKYSDEYYGASFSITPSGYYELDNPNTAGTYKLDYTVEDDCYINPNSIFISTTQYGNDGYPVGITFKEQ